MDSKQETSFDQWAIVDVMGHQRFVGRVTEEVVAGKGFVRVDMPETKSEKSWTKLIGTASIYSITPVSEAIAREMAESNSRAPVSAYDLPKLTGAVTNDPAPDYDGAF